MSLLIRRPDERIRTYAKAVFDKHFELDPRLEKEYDDRRRMLMFDDILYNLEYLSTSLQFRDSSLMVHYTIWLSDLLQNLMPDLDPGRIRQQLLTHFEILRDTADEVYLPDEAGLARQVLEEAMDALRSHQQTPWMSSLDQGPNGDIRTRYLEHLIGGDTRGALRVIHEARMSGLPLPEMYLDVLQKVMHEVGQLWHLNRLTVDKEHFSTTTTQTAMAGFYETIFSRPRTGRRILTCCVGSELHEMGIRMLSDLFEYEGWDSLYLGAAMPVSAVLHSIREFQPQLVGLSVTIPVYLRECHQMVMAIREAFPEVRIAVGGQAFAMTGPVWESWGVDAYAPDAAGLLQWAGRNWPAQMAQQP